MEPFPSDTTSNNLNPPWNLLCIHWKMNVSCIFLKDLVNLPVTEGHFVVINKSSVDVPWLRNDATRLKCYESEIPIQPFSYIVGQVANGSAEAAIGHMTRVEFFLPLTEFVPQNVNSCMLINSGPCAGIKELIKTPYIGCMKNTDIMDLAFVFSPLFLEIATHTVAAGMEIVFVCCYIYKDAN